MATTVSIVPASSATSRRALIVALAFGLLAAVLVFAFLTKAQRPASSSDSVPVLVAAQNIDLGQQISDQNVTLKQLPVSAKVPNAFTDQTQSNALSQVATEPIPAGSQILSSQLTHSQADVGFSTLIPAGQRAVAVAVSNLSDTGGLLKPGDYVDVVAAFEANSAPPNSAVLALPKGDSGGKVYFAATVVQNVRVLAVGQTPEEPRVDSSPSNAKPSANSEVKSVTLALSPDDAQKVFLAEQIGTLRLAERRFGDTSVAQVSPQDNSLPSLLAPAGQ
jgi:pilus assembly protein CpaB